MHTSPIAVTIWFQFSAIHLPRNIIKTKLFDSRLLSSSVVGNTVWGCGGYKVNRVTGDDEVGDVTGDDVW